MCDLKRKKKALKIPAGKKKRGSRERKTKGRFGILPERGGGRVWIRELQRQHTGKHLQFGLLRGWPQRLSPLLSDLSDQMDKVDARVREAAD